MSSADVRNMLDNVVLCYSIYPFKVMWARNFAREEISCSSFAFHPDKDGSWFQVHSCARKNIGRLGTRCEMFSCYCLGLWTLYSKYCHALKDKEATFQDC